MIRPKKLSDIYEQLPSREELIGFPAKKFSGYSGCYVMPCHVAEDDYFVNDQLQYCILVTGSDLDQHRRKVLFTDIPLYFSVKVPNGVKVMQFRDELKDFLSTAKENGWSFSDLTPTKLTVVSHRDTLGWDPCEYPWIRISFTRLRARRDAIKLIRSCLYADGPFKLPFYQRLKNTVKSILTEQTKKNTVYGNRYSNVDIDLLADEHIQFRRITNITKTSKILKLMIRCTDPKSNVQKFGKAFEDSHELLRKEYCDRVKEINENIAFRRRRGEDHTRLEIEMSNLEKINKLTLKEVFALLKTCNVCSSGLAVKENTCRCYTCSAEHTGSTFHICCSRTSYGKDKIVPEQFVNSDCILARDYVNRLWALVDENTVNEIVATYYRLLKENIRFCPTDDTGNLVTGHDECNDYFKTVMSEFQVSFSNWIYIPRFTNVQMSGYTKFANSTKSKEWPSCTAELAIPVALVDNQQRPLYNRNSKKPPCPGCSECIGGCQMMAVKFQDKDFNRDPTEDPDLSEYFSQRNPNPTVPNLPFLSLYWDIETVSMKPVSDVPLPKNKDDEIFMIGISVAWAGQRDSTIRIALATVPAMDCSTAFKYRARSGHGTPSSPDDPDRVFKYIYCPNEKTLILAFAQLIRLLQPDIMSGFNDQEYDFPWVVGRAVSHGIMPYFTAAVSQRVLTQHNWMYKAKPIWKKSFSSMIDDERFGIPPKVGEIIQQIRLGNHNDFMLNTAIRLIKSCYTRTDVKMEAGSNHRGESLQIEGILVVDTRLEMRRKHPKALRSSLNAFLQMLKLVTKEDMPYHVMFAVFKTAKKYKKQLFDAVMNDQRILSETCQNDLLADDSNKSSLYETKHTESMIIRRLENTQNSDDSNASVNFRSLAWDMHRVAAYCTVDAQRCHDLLFKDKILIGAIELASRCGVTLEQCFYKAGAMKVRNYCNSFAFSRLYNMCPTSHVAPNSMGDSKFPGAFVCDPKSGLYTTKLTFEERVSRATESTDNEESNMTSETLRVPKTGFSEGLYNDCQWTDEINILKRFVAEFGYDSAALNAAETRLTAWNQLACETDDNKDIANIPYDPTWTVPSNWNMPVTKTDRHDFQDFIIGRPEDGKYVYYDPENLDYVVLEDYWPTGWYQQRNKSGHLKNPLPEEECIYQEAEYGADKRATATKDGNICPQRRVHSVQHRFRRLSLEELRWCLADTGLRAFLKEHMQLVLFALDFKSLYPSLMRAFNLSVDRIVELHRREQLKIARALGRSIHTIKFPFQERVLEAYSVRHDDQIDESKAIYADSDPEAFAAEAKRLLNHDKDGVLDHSWFKSTPPTHGGEGRIRQLGFDNGIFPHLEAIMFDTRNAIKKGPLKAAKKAFQALKEELATTKDPKRCTEIEEALEQADYEIAFNNAKQLAVKIVMNTLYGESGNRHSPLFMLPVSGGITTAGKHCTLLAKYYVESVEFHTPGYGDTDSLYIEPNLRLFEHILRLYYAGVINRRECSFRIVITTMYWSKKLSQRVNDILFDDNSTRFMIMAYEEVLHPTMLISKKRYLGVAHETYFTGLTDAYNWQLINGNPTTGAHIFLRGVDVVRRGTTQFVFKTFYAVVMYLLSADCTLSPQEAIIRVLSAVYDIDWSATPEDMASSKRYKEVRNVKNYLTITAKAESDEDYISRLFRHLSSLRGTAAIRVYNYRLWDTYRDYSRAEYLQLPNRSGVVNANKIVFKVTRGELVTDYELHPSPKPAEGFRFKSIHNEWEPLLTKKANAGNTSMLEFIDRLRQRGTVIENMQRVATIRVLREPKFTVTGKQIKESAGSLMELLYNDAGENLLQKYNLQVDVSYYVESLRKTFSKMLVNWERFYQKPEINNPCTNYCVLADDYGTVAHRQRCAGRTEPTSEEIRANNDLIAADIEQYLTKLGAVGNSSAAEDSNILNDRQYIWRRIDFMMRNFYAHARCRGTPCTYQQLAQSIWFKRTDTYRSPAQDRSTWPTEQLNKVSMLRNDERRLFSGWSFYSDNTAYSELSMEYSSANIEHIREYHQLLMDCSINGRNRKRATAEAAAIACQRYKKATKTVWETYEMVNTIMEPYAGVDYDLESLNVRESIATAVIERVDKYFATMPRDEYVDNLIRLEMDVLMTQIDEYRDAADMCRMMITVAEKTLYETGIVNHWFCREKTPPLPERYQKLIDMVYKAGLDLNVSKLIQLDYKNAKSYCNRMIKFLA